MSLRLHLRPSRFSLFLFIIYIIIIQVHVPIHASAINEQYQNCSGPFRCANRKNIGYPFWGGNRPDYCGYPGFELHCEGDFPEITIMGITYKLLNIDNVEITVAREDYWDNLCPSNLVNTSPPSFSPFYYTPPSTDNLMLSYGCPVDNMTDSLRMLLMPRFQFNCSTDETINSSSSLVANNNYFYSRAFDKHNTGGLTDTIQSYFQRCGSSIDVIPLQQATLESLVAGSTSSADLLGALRVGFVLQWAETISWRCDECQESGGQCGYSAITGQFNCYCPDQAYPDSCPSGSGSSFIKRRNIYIGIAACLVGIIVISALLYVAVRRILEKRSPALLYVAVKRFSEKRTTHEPPALLHVVAQRFSEKRTEDEQKVEGFIRNCGSLAPKRYNYSDVKMMTQSFNNKLGQGGYGDVYEGELPDGRLVAVKVLKNLKGNGEEFINEVASISRTSHINIVSFLGFCYEKKKRALIYEFMPNGSLDKFINDQGSSNANRKLEWRTMYQIAVGIARGLEYLHRGCNIRIVHFDIKPHNILLDEDFCPKISDFGLAKLSEKKESIISMLDTRGTIGYIAPEVFCRTFGGVSHKSDVYSYGMMILEMVVGRNKANTIVSRSSEIYFPNAIYKNIEPENDFQLHGVVTEEEREMAKKMIIVSLWCIQTNPSDRPSMHKVLEMLEASIENLQIPPKPSLSSPRRSVEQSSAASMSTELPSQE